MAGEVERPGRTFPAALVSAVCIGSLRYVLPLMAATIDSPLEAWGDSYFADAPNDEQRPMEESTAPTSVHYLSHLPAIRPAASAR